MFLVPLALAHDPHDIAPFVSVAPDGTVMTALKDLLALSRDGQQFVYPYPGGPWLECGWALSASVLVTVGDGSIYASKDGGRSFELAGPSGVTGCNAGDDGLLVSAQGAIWSSGDGQSWSKVVDLGWDALQVLPFSGAFFLRDSAGRIYSSDDLSQPVVQGRYNTLATDGQRLVLAAADGFLVMSEDGRNFQPLATGPQDVQSLALEGDTLAAATATEAVYLAKTVAIPGICSSQPGEPFPTDRSPLLRPRPPYRYPLPCRLGRAFPAATGGRSLAPDLPPVGPRSLGYRLAFRRLPAPGHLRRRGLSGQRRHPRLARRLGQHPFPLYPSPLGGRKRLVCPLRIGGLATGKESFTALKVPGTEVGEALARIGEDTLLVGGDEGVVHRWNGSPWKTFHLDNCSRRPSEILARDQEVWAGCENQLYHSEDAGLSWSNVAEFPSQVTCLWWDRSGDLLIGTDRGAYLLNQAGVQPYAWMDIMVLEMARAPDGTLWAATSRGMGTLKEEETLLGWPVLDRPLTLAIREDGAIVAGLLDGAWWSTDQGVTWKRACSWDILDDSEGSWWWDGWEQTPLEEAKRGSVRTGTEGAIAELEVEGEHFALLAANEEPVQLSIRLDGAEEQLRLPPGPLGPRWSRAASPGLHRLQIEVLQGTLSIDALERWREPLPEEGTCGCNRDSAWLFLPFLGALRRRRGYRG